MPVLLKEHLAVIPKLLTSFELWHLQLSTPNGLHENEVAKRIHDFPEQLSC